MRETAIDGVHLAHELLYSPAEGRFIWRRAGRGRPNGQDAGTVRKDGYRTIGFGGTHLLAHRVAWYLYYGQWPDIIDHIDGDPTNNRIQNLRSVDWCTNATNKQCNREGHLPGTSYHRTRRGKKQWQASKTINGKQRFLGWYATMEAAHDAYRACDGVNRNAGVACVE